MKKSMVVAQKALINGSEIGDNTTVTLPSFEFGGSEVKGGGVSGTLTIPSIAQIGEMTTSISARNFGLEIKDMVTNDAVEIEYRFLEDAVTNDGKKFPAGTKIFMKGWLAKLEGGKIESGSPRETTAEYNIFRYREVRDGEEYLCIDKLKPTFRVGGKNLRAEIDDNL